MVLERVAFTGDGRPAPGSFGPAFHVCEVDAPVLDIGVDVSTFTTRRV